MVWIRRVRTASGATAVQIAESVDGRRRIVRHVGSARDDAELGLLIEEARRLLADDSQGELDLGITPKTVRAHMVAPPGQTLFPDQPMPRQLVVRPQVLKSSSGLLYDPTRDRTGDQHSGTDRLNYHIEESHDDAVHHVRGLDRRH